MANVSQRIRKLVAERSININLDELIRKLQITEEGLEYLNDLEVAKRIIEGAKKNSQIEDGQTVKIILEYSIKHKELEPTDDQAKEFYEGKGNWKS